MRLPSILSLSLNESYKFNSTGAQMLNSIYHMALKLVRNHFCSENVNMLLSFMQCFNGRYNVMLQNM